MPCNRTLKNFSPEPFALLYQKYVAGNGYSMNWPIDLPNGISCTRTHAHTVMTYHKEAGPCTLSCHCGLELLQCMPECCREYRMCWKGNCVGFNGGCYLVSITLWWLEHRRGSQFLEESRWKENFNL